jgi:hypothetical protein
LCRHGSIVQALPQSGFPAPDTGDKKFNSRLVAPTWNMNGSSQLFCDEPFLFLLQGFEFAVRTGVTGFNRVSNPLRRCKLLP